MQVKYRIMLVDDDQDNQAMAADALREHYEVITANDGLDALEKLDRSQPDFIILDMLMPIMDGLQTCQAIRKNPMHATVPIMFLSAHGSREQILKSYECGGNLFLTKPIEPQRLLRNVELFFQSGKSTPRAKTLTMEQLKALERKVVGPDAALLSHRAASSDAHAEMPKPVLAAEPISKPAPIHDQAKQEPKPRILLVEDDRDLVELILMSFGDLYEIGVAENGLVAIEKIITYQPDLLLIDVMLPKMNGYQLCQSIRGNSALASLPIIFITAKASPKEREYAMKIGADAFLAKPFEMPELLDMCRSITGEPRFRIRPKKINYNDMHYAETHPDKPKKVIKEEPETKWKG